MKYTVTFIALLAFSQLKAQVIDSFDINTTSANNFHSAPDNMEADKDDFYFAAFDSVYGRELRVIKGTGKPVRLTDIQPGSANSLFTGAGNHSSEIYEDVLYFVANDGTHGNEPWAYDKITGKVRMLQDINPGSATSMANYFAGLNGKIYFSARTPDYGSELWEYDPLSDTCIRLTDINPGTLNSNVTDIIAFNNKICFTATGPGVGSELFEYDPANNKVSMVADLEIGTGSGVTTLAPYVMDKKMYFWGNTTALGKELYVYDGITKPALVKDLNPGSGWGNGNLDMVAYKGALYFCGRSSTAANNDEVYKYDPVSKQVTVAFKLNANSGSQPQYLTVYKDKMYFAATDGLFGTELWQFDSTNTKRITDIMPGTLHTDINYIIPTTSGLYFGAVSPKIGNELYRYRDTTSNQPISVQNMAFNGQVTVYPNPAHNVIHIQMDLDKPYVLSVTITDINGRDVYNKDNMPYSHGRHTIDVNTQQLPAGNYIYNIKEHSSRLMLSGKLQRL